MTAEQRIELENYITDLYCLRNHIPTDNIKILLDLRHIVSDEIDKRDCSYNTYVLRLYQDMESDIKVRFNNIGYKKYEEKEDN